MRGKMHMRQLLEVIACSVDDAIEARAGGADRLEVVRELHLGGLTPAFELVRDIKNAVDLPLRVMLRESTGFQTSGPTEVERMCEAATRFETLGVDGFVIGFLKEGRIDVELTQRVLECAPNVNATFHHAFENAVSKVEALDQIKCMTQIDRLLCSGGSGPLIERIQQLANYEQFAGPRLTILAGGGIDQDAMTAIARATTIKEFHVGRAVRAGFSVNGEVLAPLVSQFVKTMKAVLGSPRS
jgi:copper homeostasis protein